ncbi:MAG TPA: MFS transporter [Nitriliruptorales bacterium]
MAALAVAIGGSASGILAPMLTGVLAVQIAADLRLSAVDLGILQAVFFGVSGATSVTNGRFVDRIGWRRGVLLATSGSTVLLLSIAVFAGSFWSLLVLLAIGGLSMSLTMPSTSLVIAREMPTARQGLTFGIKQTATPVAGMMAGLAVPAVALTIGWRWAFVMAAAVPLMSGAWAFRLREGPPVATPPGGRAPVPRALLLVAVAAGIGTTAVGGMAAFATVSAVDAGISEAGAGILVAVASLCGLTVRLASGWLADRRGAGGFVQSAALLALGAIGIASLVTHTATFVIPGTIVGYALAWGWPGLAYYGAVRHHPQAPAAATGVLQAGLSMGAGTGPLLFGVLAQAGGFPLAWAVTAGLAFTSAAGLALAGHRLHAATVDVRAVALGTTP